MRLWHKDLIPVLPDKWLVAQWRELSAISGKLIKHGSPQHALVNKITQYEHQHFSQYTWIVKEELIKRGIKFRFNVWYKIVQQSKEAFDKYEFDKFEGGLIPYNNTEELFHEWHNNKYLIQCYYNLQEKYDCGLLTQHEFDKIKQCVSFIVGGLCII